MIVLDIETTGLNRKDCGICQLSMVKVDEQLNVIDTYNTYLRPLPSAVWSCDAVNVTGITEEDVKDSPTLSQVADDIIGFLGDDDILTYNGNTFDIPFLLEEFKKYGITLSLGNRKIYDSYYIETLINPNKLGNVYQRYVGRSMEEDGLNAHDSLADVMATLEVFRHQKERIEVDKYFCINSFDGAIQRDQNGDIIFRIGKWKGLKVTDVIKKDPSWVAWIVKEKKDRDFYNIIKEEYKKVNM